MSKQPNVSMKFSNPGSP